MDSSNYSGSYMGESKNLTISWEKKNIICQY